MKSVCVLILHQTDFAASVSLSTFRQKCSMRSVLTASPLAKHTQVCEKHDPSSGVPASLDALLPLQLSLLLDSLFISLTKGFESLEMHSNRKWVEADVAFVGLS